MQDKPSKLRVALQCALATTALTLMPSAWAQQRTFDIPASNAAAALPEYARQAGVQIVAPGERLAGIRTPAIRGSMDTHAALRILLAGTGLKVVADDGHTITLGPASPATPAPAPPPPPQASAGAGVSQPKQQPQQNTAKQQKATQLAPIVVTSQKREQNLQDVPIAVTALTEPQIEALGIKNVLDLNALAPGLQISKEPSSSTTPRITMRGMGLTNPAIYFDPTVGLYLDGVYLGKAAGSVFDVVDLTRIEVLRGPQGTLYGRNTMAGAINLITPKPSGQPTGYASLEVGKYNNTVGKFSADLPKIGIASFSIGARSEQRDGWVTGTSGSSVQELNNRKSVGLRLDGLFEFSPNFTAEYRFDHSDVDQNPPYGQLYRADEDFFTAVGVPSMGSYVSRQRQTSADIDAPGFERSRVDGHSLTLDWKVNARNTFKSISAYRHVNWGQQIDLDGSPNDIAAIGPSSVKYRQWSQELQWIGHTDRLHYVGGLYYFYDSGHENGPQAYFFHSTLYDTQYGVGTRSGAAYGQLEYQPIDPLTLTAGVRYTIEEKWLDRTFGCNDPSTPNCIAQPGGFNYLIPAGTHGQHTFDALTPEYAAAWKFNEQFNVYVRYAYGFQSGGFNAEYSDPSQSSEANIHEAVTPFKPQKEKELEIGAKANLFDKRAQFSLALFRDQVSQLQEAVFVASGAAATVVRNAGSATIKGVEMEGALVLAPGTTVHATYAWLNPRYSQFLDFDPNTGLQRNFADDRSFSEAPRNSFSVAVDSRLAQFGWGTLRAHADYAYTSSMFTSPYQLQSSGPNYDPTQAIADDTKVKAYGLLNMRLVLAEIPVSSTMTGELALWCRNCANKDVAGNFIDFGPEFGHLTLAYFIDPVTYGISGTIRW